MDDFGGRTRAAMLAIGIRTPAQLGAKMRPPVPRQTVERWLAMKEADLAGKHLIALSNALNVRAHWLSEGVRPGSAGMRSRQNPEAERAATLLERMTRRQCDQWFAYGERMIKGK